MTTKVIGLRRLAFGVAAATVAAAVSLPAFAGSASAAQVQDRYIKMSNSKGGATGVSYEVGFEVATTGNVRGVVVDFCAGTDSPLPGDACSTPTGFSVGTPTVATTGGVNTGLGAGWTAASANSGRTLELTNASGGSINSGVAVKFTLSTATNPTADNEAFYARIFTFATDTAVDTWDNTADGSSTTGVVDSGGVALSTAAEITVTAKVQESIDFCVYTSGATATDCSGATGTTVTLGDTNGVLSTAGEFVDKSVKYNIATNANGNAVVRLKGDVPSADSGATIAAIGGTAAASAPGDSQFGLCSYDSGGVAGLTISAPYTGGAGTECDSTTDTSGTGSTGGAGTATFAFDTNTTDGTMSTYGDDLATKTPGDMSQGTVALIGNIDTTQAAGIYENTLSFIATGTY